MVFENQDVLHKKSLEFLDIVNELCIRNANVWVYFDNNIIKAELAGTNKTVNVIVKERPNVVEICMHTKVFPEFLKLKERRRILDPFECFPMCYKLTKSGELVLDDVGMKGYKKAMWLDKEQIIIVLKEFGKIHAMSLALHIEKPNVFQKYVALGRSDLLSAVINEKVLKHICFRLVKQYCPEKFKNFERYLIDLNESDKHAVIVQGKTSMKNLLFKYQKNTSQPIEVCFPEWQTARIGSPAFDLSFFLFTSTDREFRRNHYEYLLQVYYASLSTYLHLFDLNPAKVFPYSLLLEHMKKYSIYVLYMIYYVIDDEKCKDEEFNNAKITEIIQDFIEYQYL